MDMSASIPKLDPSPDYAAQAPESQDSAQECHLQDPALGEEKITSYLDDQFSSSTAVPRLEDELPEDSGQEGPLQGPAVVEAEKKFSSCLDDQVSPSIVSRPEDEVPDSLKFQPAISSPVNLPLAKEKVFSTAEQPTSETHDEERRGINSTLVDQVNRPNEPENPASTSGGQVQMDDRDKATVGESIENSSADSDKSDQTKVINDGEINDEANSVEKSPVTSTIGQANLYDKATVAKSLENSNAKSDKCVLPKANNCSEISDHTKSGEKDIHLTRHAPPERILFFDQNGLTELQNDTKQPKRSSAKFAKKNRNMYRSRLYHSLTSLEKKGKLWSKFYNEEEPNVKKVLDAVKEDQSVISDPADNKKRRSVLVKKKPGEKFGFTIQSYTFLKPGSDAMEQVTFVDYVELNSPGYYAGLRAGDVILAVNGILVKDQIHDSLVAYIAGCVQMRMVVLFENHVQKIELCSRSIKLRKLLMDKELEFKILSLQEERLCKGQPLLSTGDLASHLNSSSGSLHSTTSLDSLHLNNNSDWRTPSVFETDDDEDAEIWDETHDEAFSSVRDPFESTRDSVSRVSKNSTNTSSSNFSTRRPEIADQEEEEEADFQVLDTIWALTDCYSEYDQSEPE